jgi:hypothetical protein
VRAELDECYCVLANMRGSSLYAIRDDQTEYSASALELVCRRYMRTVLRQSYMLSTTLQQWSRAAVVVYIGAEDWQLQLQSRFVQVRLAT